MRPSMRAATTAVAAAALLTGTATAATATTTATPAWQRYLEGPKSGNATPVRVVSVSGQVTNPEGLVDPAKSPVTLTRTAGGAAPVVVLDCGVDVGGVPYFDVSAHSGLPVLRAAYSEARTYVGDQGDESSTTFFPGPAWTPNAAMTT